MTVNRGFLGPHEERRRRGDRAGLRTPFLSIAYYSLVGIHVYAGRVSPLLWRPFMIDHD